MNTDANIAASCMTLSTAQRGNDVDPFPVDLLPAPVRNFIEQASIAMGCDPAFVGVPALAVLAGTVGNTRVIQIKRGWMEPAIVWAVVIAGSGSMKSPALAAAVKPLREVQLQAFVNHAETVERMRAARLAPRRLKCRSPGQLLNDYPPPRFICDDVTIAVLAPILRDNPRGVLLARDELLGWLKGMSRAGGGESEHWLNVFGGRTLSLDRKTGSDRFINVPRAAVSVCGGIQPAVLRSYLTPGHFESGLLARLLLAQPPVQPKRWSDADLPPEVEAHYASIVDRLRGLKFGHGFDDSKAPIPLRMSRDATQVWINFYDEHAQEQQALTEPLSACWSKLEAYAARFALILHCVQWAAGTAGDEPPDLVEADCVSAGISLARWFGQQARHIYGDLSNEERNSGDAEVLRLIRLHEGAITPRQLMRSDRRYRTTAADAEQALQQLVDAGIGHWESHSPGAKGGRPTRRFVLGCGDGDKT